MNDDKGVRPAAESAAQILLPWQQALLERVLRITAIVAAPVLLVGGYYLLSTQNYWMLVLTVFAYGVVLAGTLLPHTNYVWRVWGFVGVLLLLGSADLIAYGWGEDARIYLMTGVLFATILLGRRHGLVALVLSAFILAVYIATVGMAGFVPLYVTDVASVTSLITSWVVFIMLAIALHASFNYIFPRLFQALQESDQLSSRLETERAALTERTSALQEANRNLQQRAIYLDASAQVSRTLTAIFEVQPLIEQAVTAISYHLAVEHTAIFLLDDAGMEAVLRAASSVGGRELLAQGYRVKRDAAGLVGQALVTEETQVAVAAGDAPVDFGNGALPTAQSALALPLRSAGELIGVLEMQCTDAYAFEADNVRVLEGLAGQLSVTIGNARRFGDPMGAPEARGPAYRLVQRLAIANTELNVCAAVLDTVQGFNPARAFVVRMPRSASAAHLATELRDGKLDVQEVAELHIASAEAMLAAIAGLEVPLLLSDLAIPSAGLSADLWRFAEQLVTQSDIRSVALVPVRSETGLLSVLFVAYYAPHDFTALERQLYQIIQDFGGAALARIQLVQTAEARVERERWLGEFGERVMRMPDLDTMMVQAAQALQDAVGADGVTVSIALPDTAPAHLDDTQA